MFALMNPFLLIYPFFLSAKESFQKIPLSLQFQLHPGCIFLPNELFFCGLTLNIKIKVYFFLPFQACCCPFTLYLFSLVSLSLSIPVFVSRLPCRNLMPFPGLWADKLSCKTYPVLSHLFLSPPQLFQQDSASFYSFEH